MLPPGHIAAGYLTAEALLHLTHPALSSAQTTNLLYWGAFFGFSPDFDEFVFFAQTKGLLVNPPAETNHREYYSHAPILWLIAGLLIYFLAASTYVKYIGLLLWLGSWSHFLLDSIGFGVMWLWPFSRRQFALVSPGKKQHIAERNFWKHSWEFLKVYSRTATFYVEIIILLTALIVLFK